MIAYTNKHKIPFQIDDDDWEIVSRYSWCMCDGYLITSTRAPSGRKMIVLHNLLLGSAPAGLTWDHWNRDKLDNRRKNLRAVTPTVSARNRALHLNNTSGVKGVYRDRQYWHAQIGFKGRLISLGAFHTIEEAAASRLEAERTLWGDEQ